MSCAKWQLIVRSITHWPSIWRGWCHSPRHSCPSITFPRRRPIIFSTRHNKSVFSSALIKLRARAQPLARGERFCRRRASSSETRPTCPARPPPNHRRFYFQHSTRGLYLFSCEFMYYGCLIVRLYLNARWPVMCR